LSSATKSFQTRICSLTIKQLHKQYETDANFFKRIFQELPVDFADNGRYIDVYEFGNLRIVCFNIKIKEKNMFCKNCGTPLNDGVSFCKNCGATVANTQTTPVETAQVNASVCPTCGNQVKEGAIFCKSCGASLTTAVSTVTATPITPPIPPTAPVQVAPPEPTPIVQPTYQPPRQAEFASPAEPAKKNSFPWVVLIVALALLLVGGGGAAYYFYYLPWKADKDAPRYYTIAPNTFLRSSQMAGVDYNVLGKVPYGGELLVYNAGTEWADVKWEKTKGFIASGFIVPKQDFILLNSIWGDADSREIINTTKCRLALLNYFKQNNYVGVIDAQILKDVFGEKTYYSEQIWQVFSKTKDSKYNTTYYKRVTNPKSKFTDFAVIIKNPNTLQRKSLLFSFSDDETPTLVYEENAPQEGDIVSIERITFQNLSEDSNLESASDNAFYRIVYR
jgi:hypothetical protein